MGGILYRYEKQWLTRFHWKFSKNNFCIDILPTINISKYDDVFNHGQMLYVKVGWLCFHFQAWQCNVEVVE